MLVINDILKERRQYFKNKVKEPLMKAIIRLAKRNNPIVLFFLLIEVIRICRRFPEPNANNLVWNNSKVALRVFKKIERYHNNPGRRALIEAVGLMLVSELEHDGYYEFLHDTYILESLREGWQPEHRGFPMYRYWTGPLYSDNWTETDADWLIKRRDELIEQADNNLNKVQQKIDDGSLWYFNLDRLSRITITKPDISKQPAEIVKV